MGDKVTIGPEPYRTFEVPDLTECSEKQDPRCQYIAAGARSLFNFLISALRFDQTIRSAFSLIDDIRLVCLCIAEYKERMAQKLHRVFDSFYYTYIPESL